MEPVNVVSGTAVPLDRSDVDTDQIIPSDWLKRVERTGFGRGLFSEWREEAGFVLNDEKFKQGKASNYFDLLLARIRDIRSSEKEFWRKVLEIYATSIDYDPRADPSQAFFATVQNKMHWAIHRHTAAELIAERADSAKPHMGLTAWPKGQVAPRKADVVIAKNYLNAEELNQLNLIVAAYLDFAALQATNQRPMYMRDWITKLDQFIQLSEREILTHAGKITAEAARAHAERHYETYRHSLAAQPSPVEVHFDEAVKKAKQLAQPKSRSSS